MTKAQSLRTDFERVGELLGSLEPGDVRDREDDSQRLSVRMSPGGRLSSCRLIRSAPPIGVNSLSLAVF